MKIRSENSGFTVTEVVVALTITSILITLAFVFTLNNLATYAIASSRADMLSRAQTAMDAISNDIRLSSSADLNNRWLDEYAPNAPINEYSWQSDADTLVLATAAEDSDGNIIFSDPSQYVSLKNNTIYYVEDGVLYKRTLAAPEAENSATTLCPKEQATAECPPDRELLKKVDAFNISYFDAENNEVAPTDARSIELYIRLKDRKFSRDVEVDYTTRTVFRND